MLGKLSKYEHKNKIEPLTFFKLLLFIFLFLLLQLSAFSPHPSTPPQPVPPPFPTSTLPLGFVLKLLLFKDFIYLFFRGKEEGGERNIIVWLSLTHPPSGTWPATQACTLIGNWTRDPLVHRPAINPLSHTSPAVHVFSDFILLSVFIFMFAFH